MGIRVHKVVGYGCCGFRPDEETKARLRELDPTTDEFVAWCEAHEREILALPHAGRGAAFMLPVALAGLRERDGGSAASLRRCVAWDDEFGLKDAIVVVPPESAEQWRRYDDFIDWAEESSSARRGRAPASRFEPLRVGLYPNSRGEVPLSVGAVLLYYGLGGLWSGLEECLYVWWS